MNKSKYVGVMFPTGSVYIADADSWELHNYSVLALKKNGEVYTMFGAGQWTQVYWMTDEQVERIDNERETSE